jgi:hypothetical protein
MAGARRQACRRRRWYLFSHSPPTHFTPCSPCIPPSSPRAPISSASPSNPSFPESSRSGELLQAQGGEDVRCLPHEVRDHPKANLSSRLEHLWRHSGESRVCLTVCVASKSNLLHPSSDSVVPLRGMQSRIRWSTLGSDTCSFSQVV